MNGGRHRLSSGRREPPRWFWRLWRGTPRRGRPRPLLWPFAPRGDGRRRSPHAL